MANENKLSANEHRDPITGEPRAHPLGTGVGTVTGAAAGVAGAAAMGAGFGTIVGPVGTVAGAIVGGLIGGLAGSAIAEDINPTAEEAYWREHFGTRNYSAGTSYDDYAPAYRFGVTSFLEYKTGDFDTIEPMLGEKWNQAGDSSRLSWDKAKMAARDAYVRVFSRQKNTSS